MQKKLCYIFLGLFIALTFPSCGFQLRGVTELSFKHLYIQGAPLSISREFKQSLKTNGIQVVESKDTADLMIEFLNEVSEKKILSLSGTGVVREFELNYQVSFRIREPNNPLWRAPQTVQNRRDYSYNDNDLLGKADEEGMLNNDMRKDAVREIMRRLTAIKLTN